MKKRIKWGLIVLLSFGPGILLLSGTAAEVPNEKIIEQAQDLVNTLCQNDTFSGTVLLAKGEEILFEKACGEASKRFHIQNNLDTKFNLGSMNKMFTAVAIMQLSEQGHLKLTDPISKYVDESWLPKSITTKIQIHHLLSHTSGLGSYFNEKYWNSSRQLFRKVADYKPLVQGDKPAFTPGKKFQYSNTGMLLLGVVIEKASKKDYFDYVRENIFKKAGMTHTDSYEMDQPVENLAIGYSPAKNNSYGWENNLYKHVIKGGPAGGGFSTVRDLHRFAMALWSEQLVSKASMELLWKDHSKEGYGYGFGIQDGSKDKVVGHGGGFPGLNANLDIFLKNGYIIAVMSNYDRAASPLAQKLNKIIKKELD